MAGLTALVVGATGAIGQALTEQLVADGSFEKVITVGRKPVQVEHTTKDATLEQHTVELDRMEAAQAAFQQADVVFCALGTTRSAAGSADQFIKVDYEYVAKAAELAKQGGAKHFSLVTAQGANANVWAPSVRLLHPLLYTKTKGMAEQAVLKQGFVHTSIFRPGLLDRGDKARTWEACALKLLGPLPVQLVIKVEDVAQQMIQDALVAAADSSSSGGGGGSNSSRSSDDRGYKGQARIYEMKQMMAAATKGRPLVPTATWAVPA